MKPLLPILLCVLFWILPGRLPAEESAGIAPKKTDVKAAMATEIKRQFPFLAKPEPEKTDEESGSAKTEIVMMNPFNVSSSYRGLLEEVERKTAQREAELFTWERGGTYLELGRLKLKVRYNPRLNKTELINIEF